MPAGNTYESIATQTLGSDSASVTFSSIPSTYTDLVIVLSARAVNTGTDFANYSYRFNGDTGTNYSITVLSGDGSATDSYRNSNATQVNAGYLSVSANTFSAHIVNIQNYANTNTFKTSLSRNNLGRIDASRTATVNAAVGLWRSTSAINSITFNASNGGFLAGSTFSLYGIASA
jgi:hypothetical protein